MLIRALLLAGALSVFGPSGAQSDQDIFSCVAPSRLALGTFTYEYTLAGSSTVATLSLERETDAGQNRIRMVYKPIPSIEAITEIDGASLAPVRGRLIVSGNESGLWERQSDEIRYVGARPGTDYTVSTGPGFVVFGSANLIPFLAAAVDWNRCPAVSVRHLVPATRSIETARLRRTGSTTLSYEGQPTEVFEIAIERPRDTGSVSVTRTTPPIVLQFAIGNGDGFKLTSRRDP